MYCLRLPHNYWNECISSCRFLSYLPSSLIIENRWISIYPTKVSFYHARWRVRKIRDGKEERNPVNRFLSFLSQLLSKGSIIFMWPFFYDAHHKNPLRSFPVNDANFSRTGCPHNLPPVTLASEERNKARKKNCVCRPALMFHEPRCLKTCHLSHLFLWPCRNNKRKSIFPFRLQWRALISYNSYVSSKLTRGRDNTLIWRTRRRHWQRLINQ